MKNSAKIAVVAAVLAGMWMLNVALARAKVEVATDYSIGAYQTDAARAIDLAESVITQTQHNYQIQMMRIEAKLDRILAAMNQLDREMVRIDARLTRIEHQLGMEAAARQDQTGSDNDDKAEESGETGT